ncbi:hypothetical protein [Oleomonas cavernae]|nr:hypothetical protein [Oleomonas cavernae]
MQDDDGVGLATTLIPAETARRKRPGAAPVPRLPVEPTVQDLRFAGQLALWSLRQGLALLKGDSDTRHLIEEAFAVAEVPRALAPLEAFLRIVAAGALRPVELRSPLVVALGHDEAVILRALAACQAGEPGLAGAVLGALLPPSAARAAAAALAHVGAAFALQGLRLADADDGRLSALEAVFAQGAISARVH